MGLRIQQSKQIEESYYPERVLYANFVRTWNRDIDLKSAAFVRSADWTRNGSGESGEVVGFWADPDTRSIFVFLAILELLLDSTEIYHLPRDPIEIPKRETNPNKMDDFDES